MTPLENAVAFIVAIGILVVIHELGHYCVARMCGVKVLRFSFGIGKVVFLRRFGPDQTEWVISMLPLGGYVKMLDARDVDAAPIPAQDARREFSQKNVWQRIAIVAAGPIANFILAICVLAGLNSYGVPEPTAKIRVSSEQSSAFKSGLRNGDLITAVNGEAVKSWADFRWKLVRLIVEKEPIQLDVKRPNPNRQGGFLLDAIRLQAEGLTANDLEGDFLAKLGIGLAGRVMIGEVFSNGAAAQAGLKEGDQILDVDGVAQSDAFAFVNLMKASPEQLLHFTVIRRGETLLREVRPFAQNQDGKRIGKISAQVNSAADMISVAHAPLNALNLAVNQTWETSVLNVKMIGKMIVGEVSLKNITGPVTIADYAGKTARTGLISFLGFIAFISISLGVMNLLPIPVLDGGLLLYYSVEVLTGRPMSERLNEIAQRAGFGMLMLLMVVALFNDIVRQMH